MSDTPQLLLAHHLKALKLPTFLREYDKQARQCAAEGVDHVRYLVRLTELELIDRERRMVERRIRMAKFPAVKSLDSFDFKAMPSLNKMMVLELARCEYIERRENIIALGNSGTGKTHIALGLGLAACQKGLTVGFITAAALVHELIEARDEKRLLRFQKQLAKYKLLIIDELGFVPLRVRPETLCRITEFSEHESNGRELDEGERVAVEVLPVLGQSAAAVEPGDGAFDHPTPGLDDEALHPIGSLDDLGLEIGQDAGQGAVKDRPLIGAVGEQFPEKGKQTEQGRQQRETAVAILNVGGGDDAVQQQALRIDQNMPLLALDQLAGIEAVAVDASPPFSALFTL